MKIQFARESYFAFYELNVIDIMSVLNYLKRVSKATIELSKKYPLLVVVIISLIHKCKKNFKNFKKK